MTSEVQNKLCSIDWLLLVQCHVLNIQENRNLTSYLPIFLTSFAITINFNITQEVVGTADYSENILSEVLSFYH